MPANDLPRITVITPNLNQGRFIERAICSVVDQGYANLEYIVVDGASADESVPLIQHYDDDITWWRSQQDRGPADAINQALKHATGEWVLILGADDLLLPGVLESMAERLVRTDADWLIGHTHRIGQHDDQIGRVTCTRVDALDRYLMHDVSELPLQASFFRRSLFERHGRFDATLQLAYGYEFTCRLLADGVRPTILPQVVAAQREHAQSLSARHVLRGGLEWITVAERYAEALPLKARYALWKNCDERRRIYALAEAESRASEARRFLWQQLLRRPWWVASDQYRQTLLNGVAHPASDATRPAAAA